MAVGVEQAFTSAPASRGPSAEEIATRLRERLARGETLPPERRLAEEIAVKRHLLRRALELLRRNGELSPARVGRPAKSPFPAAEAIVRRTNPLEVIELRLVLEPALARLAALRASPAEIDGILHAATSGPEVEYGAADLAFHRALAAAAHNHLATELYALLRSVAHDRRIALQLRPAGCLANRRKERDAEHLVIAEAVKARDPDAAAEAMRRHLAAVQQQIVARLVPGPVPTPEAEEDREQS